MLNHLDEFKLNSETSFNNLVALGYKGENNLYSIIDYFETELSVYFDRKVIVDTDDDDFYPKTFVLYEYTSLYRPSWTYRHDLVETNDENEATALINCVEYTIDAYAEYMVELDKEIVDSDTFNIFLENQ